jgi:NADH-quinone oxidoreductase subunit A
MALSRAISSAADRKRLVVPERKQRCVSMRAWLGEIVHKPSKLPMQGWLSILIMIALGAGFALVSVLLSSVLGPKKPTPEKLAPYECGHAGGRRRPRAPVDQVLPGRDDLPALRHRGRVPVSWAMALRDLGWNGFIQVLLFMALLLAGYIYVWRKGALDWGNENA